MAQNNSLEDLIRDYKHPRILIHRIKDSFQYGAVRHKTLCDAFGCVNGHPLLLECKETSKDRLHVSKLYRDVSSHQLKALMEWHRKDPRNIAGYLILFKAIGFISFLNVKDYDPNQGAILPNSTNVKTAILDSRFDLEPLLTGA